MPVKTNVPFQRMVTQAAPAAGAEFVITAPGNGLWRVISLVFRLATSAVVANRAVMLVADDGTDIWFRSASSIVQAASATVDYGAFAGGSAAGTTGVVGTIPLTQDGLWLQPGWRVRTITNLIDATDQYSNVAALVEEYPGGPGTEWVPTLDRAEYERS